MGGSDWYLSMGLPPTSLQSGALVSQKGSVEIN